MAATVSSPYVHHIDSHDIVCLHFFSEIERRIRVNDGEYNAQFEYAVSDLLTFLYLSSLFNLNKIIIVDMMH